MAIFDKVMNRIDGLASWAGKDWKYFARGARDLDAASYLANRPRLRSGLRFAGGWGAGVAAATTAADYAATDDSFGQSLKHGAVTGLAAAGLAGGWAGYAMTGQEGKGFFNKFRGLSDQGVLDTQSFKRGLFEKGANGSAPLSRMSGRDKLSMVANSMRNPGFWF